MKEPSKEHSRDVQQMDKALRGVESAVETYDQVLEKLQGDPKFAEISALRDDHRATAEELKARIISQGGTPSQEPGAWGTFAETVTGAAKLIGDKPSLKALKEGEEHGAKLFRELRDESNSASVKTYASEQLLPQQEQHIRTLDVMMEAM